MEKTDDPYRAAKLTLATAGLAFTGGIFDIVREGPLLNIGTATALFLVVVAAARYFLTRRKLKEN
jgi:hypothetical protein